MWQLEKANTEGTPPPRKHVHRQAGTEKIIKSIAKFTMINSRHIYYPGRKHHQGTNEPVGEQVQIAIDPLIPPWIQFYVKDSDGHIGHLSVVAAVASSDASSSNMRW